MSDIRQHGPSLALLLCAFVACVSCAVGSWAGSQAAHVHGEAELTLSIENGLVEVQPQSPAANIVGFESRATTAEQVQRVLQAKATLEAAPGLFSFSGTACHRKSAVVDVSSVTASTEGEHEAHAPQDTEEDSHPPSDDHHAGDAHDSQHSEIVANYRFQCNGAAGPSAISVNVFDAFPGIERMQALWVTPSGQGAIALNAQHRIVSFE